MIFSVINSLPGSGRYFVQIVEWDKAALVRIDASLVQPPLQMRKGRRAEGLPSGLVQPCAEDVHLGVLRRGRSWEQWSLNPGGSAPGH